MWRFVGSPKRGGHKMKALNALALITVLAVISPAQRSQNNSDEKLKARNAPGVFIYSASAFGPDKNGNSNLTIEVGNIGSKTLNGITWEYQAVGLPIDRRVNTSFRNNELKLTAGGRIKLTQPVHYYSDKFVVGFTFDTVRVMHVDYEGGESWDRPANDD